MPAPLNILEKLALYKLKIIPAPMIDVFGGFTFYAVAAAIRLNIFEELHGQSLTLDELSMKIKCDRRALEMTLEALEPLGYIKKKGDKYQNTKITEKFCLDSSEPNMKLMYSYYFHLMNEFMPHLEKSIIKGSADKNFYEWLKDYPEIASNYQRFMISLAKLSIPGMLKNIKLKNEDVLDIGGSHGMYDIALCKKYNDISLTIIDGPYAMDLLQENLKSNGLAGKVNVITGDFMEYNFDKKFDVILLFNVLHEHPADYNLRLIKKISERLNPGGRLIILDELGGKKMTAFTDHLVSMFQLVFFHLINGEFYSLKEISGWLKECGFKKIKKRNFIKSGATLITAYL